MLKNAAWKNPCFFTNLPRLPLTSCPGVPFNILICDTKLNSELKGMIFSEIFKNLKKKVSFDFPLPL